MRHRNKINHLGRTYSHRAAMLSNMAVSLIMHKRIFTTLAKAKELRKYVEPLITKSKEANHETVTEIKKVVTVKHKNPDTIKKYGEESQIERTIKVKSSTAARRVVFSYLKNNEAVKILFGEIAQKVADRPGGYTRIIKTGNRLGDNAEMCFIELVDYNELMLKASKKTATKTRRSRRGSGRSAATTETSAPAKPVAKAKDEPVEAVVENIEAEVPVVEEAPVAEEDVPAVAEEVSEVAEESAPKAE